MRKKKEQNIEEVINFQSPIGQVTNDAYLDIGNYVNNHRHMCALEDGCKVSYRRLIWSALQFSKGKMIPATTLLSQVSNYHPHSLTGLEGFNSVLVNSGIFTGEGAFGFTEITGTVNPPAAPRYLKARLSDLYWDIMGDLIKYVPKSESPVGDMEIDYLPIPLPLALFLKTSVVGLGFSIASNYPNFSPQSLYQAYIHNDPNLLEPNVNLELDKKKSDLRGLWETGKGAVTYSYHVYRATDPSGKSDGFILEGDTCLFTPRLTKIKRLIDENKVYLDDLTDMNGPKLFIGRIPGARGITIEDLEKVVMGLRSNTTVYNINITNSTSSYRIPLRDWIGHVLNNYHGLLQHATKEKMKSLSFELEVLTNLPKVVEYITKVNPMASNEELSKTLKISPEIIQAIMSKPISSLRKNKDNTEKIEGLKQKIKDLKNFDSKAFTENIIQKL